MSAEEPPPSVVVVMIDTLRADHLSVYGYPHETTPYLEAFASEGTLFRNAIAASPYTGPSVASVVTGRMPDEVGIQELLDPLPPSATTLAEVLGDNGYWTGAVVSNGFAGPDYLHDQGYEHFVFEPYKEREDPKVPNLRGLPRFTADRVTNAALGLLADAEAPYFLYVHYTDPHDPYLAPERWRDRFVDAGEGEVVDGDRRIAKPGRPNVARLRRQYDAEVAFTDHEVGRLLKSLPRDDLVVVTADHGEEFMEHGVLGHGHSLHEELLRVPLLWRGPGVAVGSEVDAIVSHADLMPTLLELVAIPPPSELTGRSLASLLSGEVSALPSRLVFSVLGSGPARGTAVRDDRWKMVEDARGRRLFDLASPETDHRDVSLGHPDVVARLGEALDRRRARATFRPHFDGPEMQERREEALRSLGYIE